MIKHTAFLGAVVGLAFFSAGGLAAAQEDEQQSVEAKQPVTVQEQDKDLIENIELLKNLDLFKEQDIDLLHNLELFIANS